MRSTVLGVICQAIPMRGANWSLGMLMVEVYSVVSEVSVLGWAGCGMVETS
jgi:hypothetical protein